MTTDYRIIQSNSVQNQKQVNAVVTCLSIDQTTASHPDFHARFRCLKKERVDEHHCEQLRKNNASSVDVDVLPGVIAFFLSD